MPSWKLIERRRMSLNGKLCRGIVEYDSQPHEFFTNVNGGAVDCTELEIAEAVELLANGVPVNLTDYQTWQLGIDEGRELTAQDVTRMIKSVTSESRPMQLRDLQ